MSTDQARITRARRGDAVVIQQHRVTYMISQPSQEHDDFEVGIVTGISRDGMVRKWRSAWYGADGAGVAIPERRSGLWLLPAAEFDVTAVIEAARAHCWPGHPDQPMPFASLGEVRKAMRPCRRPA